MNHLPGSVHVSPDTEALFEALGETMMSSALDAVEQRGVFHVALSGGGTPEPFYIRLLTDPKFRLMPWAKTHLWIVDERCVPEDHDKSNIKMIREALSDHAGIPEDQVHPMPVLADDPAGDYEDQLSKAFDMIPADGVPQLDWVLLGMGGDCHTASLFPESPALTSTRWIDSNDGEKVVPPPRVTMTYPLINAAREIAVLAVGGGKTAALTRVATQIESGSPDIVNIPISGIAPDNLTWYLDNAAAG